MWTAAEIAEVVGGRLHRPDPSRPVTGFSVDSRTLRPGELFVALPGARTDGHLYVGDAFRRGAAGALVQRWPSGLSANADVDTNAHVRNVIEVPDPLEALQRLAEARRRALTIPLVGVTGSSGKTTTKELLYALLSPRARAYRSPGNFNTEIGLPLALLNMPSDAEVGIFEVALQRPGDIGLLARILRPTVGVLTALGEAHLEFFGSEEALAREKWRLLEALPSEGAAVVNADAPFVGRWLPELERRGLRVVTFGLKRADAAFRAREIDESRPSGLRFTLVTPGGSVRVRTRLLGRANVYNVLGAVAAAWALREPDESDDALVLAALRALREFRPVPRRLEPKRSRRFGLILDDSYNANPTAVREALHALARLRFRPPRRRVLVFGDMLELGARAPELHRGLADAIVAAQIDYVFAIGARAGETARALLERHGWPPERVFLAKTQDELLRQLERALPDDRNAILVKGSRGMALDRVVDALIGR